MGGRHPDPRGTPMARKKKRPGGTRPHRRPHSKGSPPPPSSLPPLGDPRVAEGSLWEFVREQSGRAEPETPLDRAQALVYRAFRERDPGARARLAREALA